MKITIIKLLLLPSRLKQIRLPTVGVCSPNRKNQVHRTLPGVSNSLTGLLRSKFKNNNN